MQLGKRPADADAPAPPDKVVTPSTSLFQAQDGIAALTRSLDVIATQVAQCAGGPLVVVSQTAEWLMVARPDGTFRMLLRFLPLTADNLCWWMHAGRMAYTLSRAPNSRFVDIQDAWWVAARPRDLLARLGVAQHQWPGNAMQWVVVWRMPTNVMTLEQWLPANGIPPSMATWIRDVADDIRKTATEQRVYVRHVRYQDLWVSNGLRARLAMGPMFAVVDFLDTYERHHRWRSLRVGGADPPARFISNVYTNGGPLQWEGMVLLSLAAAFLGLLVASGRRPAPDVVRVLLAMLPSDAQLVNLMSDAMVERPLRFAGLLARLQRTVADTAIAEDAWHHPVTEALTAAQLHIAVPPLADRYLSNFETFFSTTTTSVNL